VLDPYSCVVTASGGVPNYFWTLFVNGTIDYDYSLPSGLSTPYTATTYGVAGKPDLPGTYTLTVQVGDQEPGWPPATASTTFTLIVR
jgi:hypothetical protein